MLKGDIDLEAVASNSTERSRVDPESVSALKQIGSKRRWIPRRQAPPTIFAASPSLDSTPSGQLASALTSQHSLTPPVLASLPQSFAQDCRPPTLPLNSGFAIPRTYPVVVECATGRRLGPGYLDRIRYFVDPDFADENWGDRYMTAIGEQPKYVHCVDLRPDPHGLKDWEAMFAGMYAKAEKVDSGGKTKENRMNSLVCSSEMYGTAFRPTANLQSMIATAAATEEEADADFQTFAATGIGACDLYR